MLALHASPAWITEKSIFCVCLLRDAKIQFSKYAAPLLHLSGMDVTVVEVRPCRTVSHFLSTSCLTSCPLQSEYQGHIQMLMQYVDPHNDGIIIAGGDGTVMEVLNGLMQRRDAVSAHPSPPCTLAHDPVGVT